MDIHIEDITRICERVMGGRTILLQYKNFYGVTKLFNHIVARDETRICY